MFFMIIVAIILFVFIPCLIIFIINLVNGISKKWPKRHLIPTIITGIVLSVVITLALGLVFLILLIRAGSGDADTNSSQVAVALYNYLPLIIY